MITEFDVVHNGYLSKVIEEVNEKLKEGWELHGQMIINDAFYQAIKRIKGDKEE